jgi:hypothetical protein
MAALKLLDAVTATGASDSKKFNYLVQDHTVQATITGAPSAVTVDLEGSLDGVTFFSLESHVFTAGELTATGAMFHIIDKPVLFVNINLTTLTGGSAPTVTALYEGDSSWKSKISRRGEF